ncbi:HNH endonuclease [Rhizobium sp. UBA1881]|uniref:HNH endonuclease n=1 Tax=Rhizobium sp. UBA1881 TaxID=1947375 RepID=UPI0025F7C677|nr:hypothetical protein [Rhizobium sp. UBA1881]
MIERHRLMELLDYDPDTGVFRWRVSPSQNVKAGAVAGCHHSNGRSIRIEGQLYYAKHLAWLYVHGVWPPKEIRYLDGDITNDAIANLAGSDSVQRVRRQPMRKDNQSGARGVYQKGTRHVALIRRQGKTVHQSSHATRDEAIEAHRLALAAIDAPGGGLQL